MGARYGRPHGVAPTLAGAPMPDGIRPFARGYVLSRKRPARIRRAMLHYRAGAATGLLFEAICLLWRGRLKVTLLKWEKVDSDIAD